MKLLRIFRFASRVAASNCNYLSLPYRLTYAVTNRCQAHCDMCNIWRKPAGSELSAEEIDTLFSKANRFSWINLTGGELFQRPDIRDILLTIIKQSKDLYLLNFPTNGIQTGDIVASIDAILRTYLPRLIVSVSLDGPRELHDRIRGFSGCWDNAMATYIQLRERSSSRFSVYLGHTMQTGNQGAFEETLNACRSICPDILADDFHINLAHSSGHYYDNTDTETLPDPHYAAQEIERINRVRTSNLFDPVAFVERRYRQHTQHYLKQGRVPLLCQAAAASCFIDPQGIIYPCTGFAVPLGSLRDNEMDLYRIWRSEKRLQTRRQICACNCPGCWTPCEAYQTILGNLLK